MQGKVKVVLAGIGGYGGSYLRALDVPEIAARTELVGLVDPAPERCGQLPELQERGLQIFPDLKAFYAGGGKADLALLCVPIHLHAPLSCMALENGSNVLCEKPLCAVPEEAETIMAAEAAHGKFAAIGYQWSFCPVIQRLKQDIMAGVLGRPRRFRTLALWPRTNTYYNRSRWAGRIRSDAGDWVLDSPVNNATAHYLHNMLYLLGDKVAESAHPASVQAELYRANPIENYDTGALRIQTVSGVEILFLSTHAIPARLGPISVFEFENAVVNCDTASGFSARFNDGSTRAYGVPDGAATNKVRACLDAITEKTPLLCPVKAALPHTLCVNAAQESCPEIKVFPESMIKQNPVNDEVLTFAAGLDEAFIQCYTQGLLPSELGGLPWTVPGKKVCVK